MSYIPHSERSHIETNETNTGDNDFFFFLEICLLHQRVESSFENLKYNVYMRRKLHVRRAH